MSSGPMSGERDDPAYCRVVMDVNMGKKARLRALVRFQRERHREAGDVASRPRRRGYTPRLADRVGDSAARSEQSRRAEGGRYDRSDD